MATKLGFSIESSLASNHLTDAKYIKGGFFVVNDTATRDALVVATDTQDGTIEDGSFCFCKADRKFYQYDGREVDGVVKGWVEKDFSEGGGSGGGEQGTPRATNYVFENHDRFSDWWISEDRPQLVKGDAFYIGNVPWIDDTEKAFYDYIWDGTSLKETIMPFAKLPLPVWLDEGDGSMKKTLSLLDIGIPDWMGEMSVAAERDGNFQNCSVFISSVNGVLADFEDIHNYAKKDDIPTTLPASDVPAWAKAANPPTYNAADVGAVPTSRTVNGKALSADISLSATDIGALPNGTFIPKKVSELDNDEGFVNTSDVNDLINTAFGGVLNGEY